MPSFTQNRIVKFLPIALLIVLAVAVAEAETAYLRRALGVEIGFSCADWLGVYMDMSESVDIDERLSQVTAEHVSYIEAGGADGYMKEVLDYDAAKSAGAPAPILALAERMTAFHNEMVDIALEDEARYGGMSEYYAIFDMKMSDYPRVQAYMAMQGYDEAADCR